MIVGKLYLSPTSPAARAVLLAEKALGISTEHIMVNLKEGEHLKPDFIKLNPQHTVPTFVDKNGTVVWDSHAILPYLVCKFGKDDSLYPKDLAKRAVVDQRLHFESGSIYPVLKQIVMPIVQKGATGPTEESTEMARNVYALLEAFLDGNDWIAFDKMTIADLSIIASISSLMEFISIDASKFPKLNAWVKRCEALPFYDVNLSGIIIFRNFIKDLISK